ncbi:hypothetical protein BJX61DRAFT_230048 [Aspergillus egyptiacus]|nr:hypothetical protein BJX61DRAFT_230048 [Aspergillus egyptiacus]
MPGTETSGGDCLIYGSRLSYFWPDDQVEIAENTVLDNSGTESVSNLICITMTVHGLWGNARFALKPLELSKDKRKLTVEFHWLPGTTSEFTRLRTPPDNPSNLESSPNGTLLLDCETRQFISSSHIITFTTDSPEKRPLPSVELLQMQWVLNRLVAIAGAADLTDEELDDDDLLIPVDYEMEEDLPAAVGEDSESDGGDE